MKILIPGIGRKIGQMVAKRLAAEGHKVQGIDRRGWPSAPKGVVIHQVDIRKRAAENVFRKFRPQAVIHMATVSHVSAQREGERFRINMGGTRAIFDYCHKYGVKQVLFIGRHTYYGAAPDSPLYHTEEEPPMGLDAFPELADLVSADLYAGSALWRFPDLKVAVLRMSYTLGPSGHGTLARFLRGRRVPMVFGFDPLYQFMHERDAVEAICLSLEKELNGVFNVSGPQPVPLSYLVRETGRSLVPLPEALFAWMLGRFGLPKLPRGALNHIKYSIVIDSSAFREATGFSHQVDEIQTMHGFKEYFPIGR